MLTSAKCRASENKHTDLLFLRATSCSQASLAMTTVVWAPPWKLLNLPCFARSV